MRFIVLLGLAALVCNVCCRDLRGENLPRLFRLGLPKDKRGLSDHPPTFPSHGPISYAAPVHSGLSSGYNLGGSSGGFPLGLHGLGGSVGQGIGYSLTPSAHLASGYISPGQSHGSLSLQGLSLGGHAAQSTYPVPSVTNLAGGSNGFFIPSKTGPVTFGLHGGSGTSQGLSAYSNGGSSINLPVMLTSSHGLLGSSGSSYSFPVHSASSGSSYPVTGGLVIASGSHGSSSYNLPASGSTHGISALSGSSGSHAASSAYTLPITSGSHGISALSSGSTSSNYAASGSPASSGSHAGLSSASSDSSSYEMPISSGSYSSSGSSGSYANYLSPQDSSSSYSSGGSTRYSSPAVSYATSSSNYVDGSSSGYSDTASGYSPHSSSHSNPSSSYSSPSSSYSSPIVSYAGTSSYTPKYLSPSGSYGTPSESHGSYSSVSPRYLRYVLPKAYDNENSESIKYDTISYSSPDGKYSIV